MSPSEEFEGKVQCRMCEQWFKEVNSQHIARCSQALLGLALSVRDYKLRYEITSGTSLSSPGTFELRQKNAERTLPDELRLKGRVAAREVTITPGGGISPDVRRERSLFQQLAWEERKQREAEAAEQALRAKGLCSLLTIAQLSGIPSRTLYSAAQSGRLDATIVSLGEQRTIWGIKPEALPAAMESGKMEPRDLTNYWKLLKEVEKLSEEL